MQQELGPSEEHFAWQEGSNKPKTRVPELTADAQRLHPGGNPSCARNRFEAGHSLAAGSKLLAHRYRSWLQFVERVDWLLGQHEVTMSRPKQLAILNVRIPKAGRQFTNQRRLPIQDRGTFQVLGKACLARQLLRLITECRLRQSDRPRDNVSTPVGSTSPPRKRASLIGAFPLIFFSLVCIGLRNRMPNWAFMWTLAFSIFGGLKWLTWRRERRRVPHGAGRPLAYLLAWPGMDAKTFLDCRNIPRKPRAQDWLWAVLKMALGVTLLWGVARRIPPAETLVRGWIGLFGLIFLLHFGSFHVVALFWQRLGIRADPIMAEPIRSKTLSEFWSKRWNLGFRQLAYDLIFRPLHRRIGAGAAGLLVFVLSGLIHDLVISFPARAGYGLPTAYFTLQGFGVALERSVLGRYLGLQQGIRARVFMLALTAGPAFWLFHPPFVRNVIVPFMRAIHAI